MQNIKVNIDLAIQHGLLPEEFEKICNYLGRTPNYTELGIYSVMWSEHCSYKNSIALLKTLPRSGSRLLVKAGEENAGLVDIGENLAVCFKIESHNHPSAVEPYQGAATGVGGILRDIFTMGAEPIAALDSLRFGDLSNERTQFLFDLVVKGIGDYGNCFGVPTIGGEVYFNNCYQDNCLVNAMAVGIVDTANIAKAIAIGEGNPVFIVGSSTGRDGIHGATFASVTLSEDSESKKSNVQVGDPFTEKLLLEASLEIIKKKLIVGIQDMGAAGIICSTSEMSARGNSGMIIDLDKVPLREQGMTAYEILLSESQERMLVVGNKGKEKEIKEIFEKWDLNCVEIGSVINENKLYFYKNSILTAEVPADTLVLGGGAPVYFREIKKPEYIDNFEKIDIDILEEPVNYNEVIKEFIKTPNIANKNWVYQQYDHQVGTNTVVLPGGDAGVVRVKGTNKALSLKTDCNGRFVYMNPRWGAISAVAESARNVVCTGARPIAITNCLNFGDPYNPEIYWQFSQVIEGMREACEFFDTPVTGGNVSFYNESQSSTVYPTPVIGMLGLIEDASKIMTSYFKKEGDLIYLIGETKPELGGSEYLMNFYNKFGSKIPELNLNTEKILQSMVLKLIDEGMIQSAHDCSEGGLLIALIEAALMNKNSGLGAVINIDFPFRKDIFFFSESQSRVVVTVTPQNKGDFESILKENQMFYLELGVVIKNNLIINDFINLSIEELSDLYYNSIKTIMNK